MGHAVVEGDQVGIRGIERRLWEDHIVLGRDPRIECLAVNFFEVDVEYVKQSVADAHLSEVYISPFIWRKITFRGHLYQFGTHISVG